MANWNAIAERIARGMYGEQWAKEDAAKQDLEKGALGMELARSGESRAAKKFESDMEEEEYGKKNRFRKERSDDLAFQGSQQDVAWNSGREGRYKTEEGRKDKEEKRADTRLGHEGRRIKISEAEAADLQASRAVEREGGSLRNEAQRIQNAIADVDDPSLRVVLSNKQRELERLIASGTETDQPLIAAAMEELDALTEQYSANQRAVREARATARRKPGSGVLLNQGPASPYDIFKR